MLAQYYAPLPVVYESSFASVGGKSVRQENVSGSDFILALHS